MTTPTVWPSSWKSLQLAASCSEPCIQLFGSKRDSVSPFLDAITRNPSNFCCTKIFSTGVTKVSVFKNAICQSELDLVGRAVFFSDDQMQWDSIPDGNTNRPCHSGDRH